MTMHRSLLALADNADWLAGLHAERNLTKVA
jgi:hypothetical protein